MKPALVQLLEKRFQAEIDTHKYNLEVLLANERSIPEHSNFVDEVANILDDLTEAKDRLDTLRYFYGSVPKTNPIVPGYEADPVNKTFPDVPPNDGRFHPLKNPQEKN